MTTQETLSVSNQIKHAILQPITGVDMVSLSKRLFVAIVLFSMLLGAKADAQSTSGGGHVPLQKTIGQGKPDIVPSLIVMNARGATLQGGKLVLTGMSPNSIIFADRPVRSAGHDLTSRVIEDWGAGADNFAKDPPNAIVSGFSKEGSNIRDAVVVLKSPKLDGDRLTFAGVATAGAVAAGAVAAGAAAAYASPYAPYGAYPYYAPRCGYYPLPPCY